MDTGERSGWHVQQALQIAAQLPGEPEEAFKILSLVEEILRFLYTPPPPPAGGPDQAVVRFPGGSSSPSRRTNSSGNPSAFPK